MCNKTSESGGGTLSAQGWMNEAQKHLTDPAQPVVIKTQDKNLRRAVQCIIYACRQFRERQKEGYYAGRGRRGSTLAYSPLNRGRRASDKPVFKRMLDTIAEVRKELKVEKEKVEKLINHIDLTKDEGPVDVFAIDSGVRVQVKDGALAELGRKNAGEEEKSAVDNWKHRSLSMRCKTCMSYVTKSGGTGRCRRRSPTLAGWPVVYDSDWCNDHKIDENKVVAETAPVLKESEETVVSRCLAKECRDYNGVQGCARKRIQISTSGECCTIDLPAA